MNIIETYEEIQKLINNNKIVLIYFSGNTCGVCNIIKPKLEEILKSYPKVKNVQIDVEKSLKTSAAYDVFTVPAIIVFVEGKESIRTARYINLQEIDEKISRYYDYVYF